MKVDIVKADDGTYSVYGRDARDYDHYTSGPIYGPADRADCEDWCEDNHHTARLRKWAALVPEKFIHDLEAKCDRAYSNMTQHASLLGWRLTSNVTYRASAAWKDQPTHYCYLGDLGGQAKFENMTDENAATQIGEEALQFLKWLKAVSSGIWELGFTLTFDKDGKHTIYGAYPQWVTLDEED